MMPGGSARNTRSAASSAGVKANQDSWTNAENTLKALICFFLHPLSASLSLPYASELVRFIYSVCGYWVKLLSTNTSYRGYELTVYLRVLKYDLVYSIFGDNLIAKYFFLLTHVFPTFPYAFHISF